jgi:hypothetical protein
MKPPVHLLALALVTCLLTGCVIFPHGEWVAPPASGQVLDAENLQPIAQAKVVRSILALNRTRVASTDEHGAFELKKDRDLRWLPFVCYGAGPIDYRIEAEGYQPFTTNRYGGGSFSQGRQPHGLGHILMHRAGE